MVGLVFTEQGTLYQHAAIVMVCATQLVVQARAQPYITWTENALQYLGTFLTFAMSFGGMLMQNLKVSQKEAAQRLFGDAKDTMDEEYRNSIRSVQAAIDLILVLVIISAVGVLGYQRWEKRQESKVALGKLGGKMKRLSIRFAVCCGCGTEGMRASLAAAQEENRRRVEAEEAQGGAQGGGEAEETQGTPLGVGEEKHAGDVELTERPRSVVVMDHGNPMRIAGGGASA